MGIFSNMWRHVRRSPYQAFTAISIMVLTFVVTGLFTIVSLGSVQILAAFEKKPQIIVFFKDTKEDAEIKGLAGNLAKMDKVADVKYVSKEEALTQYKEKFQNDPLLLEMVSADILPASIEVSAAKIEYLPELAQMLKQEKDVDEIIYQKEVVDLLVSWTRAIRYVGFALILFLGAVAFLNVITVISLKIALRREEIEILQLVGASSWYIRLPFFLEGMTYGLIGSILATGLNLGLLLYATPFMQKLFVGVPLFPIPLIYYALFTGFMVVLGVFLGLLASSVAVNRYIK